MHQLSASGATPDYLTSAEVARLADTTPSTVTRWVRAGLLPAYRFGHRLKFLPEDVESFIKAASIGGDR